MKKTITVILMTTLILSFLFSFHLNIRSVVAVEGTEINLTNDTQVQGNPAIYGNKVVWIERISDSGPAEIFFYNLSISEKFRITYNTSTKQDPEIYDNIIVWEDNRHGNYDIYMYDLAEDTDGDNKPNYLDDDRPFPDPAEIRVTDNPAHQENPAIYGTKIVWEDLRHGNRDVYIYDLITHEEVLIAGLNELPSEKPLSQKSPRIYGDKIVWQEDSFYFDSEIFFYNLSVDNDNDGIPNYLDEDRPIPDPAMEQITSNSEFELYPSIYNNCIVFSRSDDIYLYDIRLESEYRLTNSTPDQKIDGGLSSFQGTKVVWAYEVEGSRDIYMYDLALDSDNDGEPNYLDADDPNRDDAVIQITYQSEPIQMKPAVHTNRIVFQDKRNISKPEEIYVFTLTENLPPEILNSSPKYSSEILEGESLMFNIVISDPELDDITFMWFFDEIQLLGEDTNQYEYISDYGSAGMHEVKVVASDGEYPVEEIWLVYVKESGIEPLMITKIDPVTNPTITEGGEVTFNIWVRYEGSGEPNDTWSSPADPIFYYETGGTELNGEIFSMNTYFLHTDINGSNDIKDFNITVVVTDGIYTTSYTWILTVLYFDDADMDGYNDSTEIKWNSDPLDITSTPEDLDKDFIPDGDDDDKDGDGLLDKYDDYPLNPKKQKSGDPDYFAEILIIIIILIVVLVAIITIPGILKSRKQRD